MKTNWTASTGTSLPRWRATAGFRWRNSAAKVGLSKTPVQARVRRLEKDGFIRGYSAIIDRERMGEGHVAFVQVKLSDTRSAGARRLQPRRAGRAGDRAMPHDGGEFRLSAESAHPRHRRLSPRARRAHLRPAPCRADLDLRGDGDGEGPLAAKPAAVAQRPPAAVSSLPSAYPIFSKSPCSSFGRRTPSSGRSGAACEKPGTVASQFLPSPGDAGPT